MLRMLRNDTIKISTQCSYSLPRHQRGHIWRYQHSLVPHWWILITWHQTHILCLITWIKSNYIAITYCATFNVSAGWSGHDNPAPSLLIREKASEEKWQTYFDFLLSKWLNFLQLFPIVIYKLNFLD